MADPEKIARARALLANGRLSPQVRAELQAFVGSSAPAPGPAMAPAPAQPPPADPIVARQQKALATVALPKSEASPTAYYPTSEKSDYPLMFTEDRNADDEAGWQDAMKRAEGQGRRAYRVSREFPLNEVPGKLMKGDFGSAAETVATRLGTDLVGPAVMGLDNVVTGGLLTKGIIKGEEAAGVLPEGAYYDLARQAQTSPLASFGGTLAGSAAGLAKGVAQTANLIGAPMMTSPVKKAAGYALSGALGGGALSGTQAAVGSAMGEDRDIGAEAKTGAYTGALSNLVFGGLGELGRNRTAALRNPEVSKEATDLALAEQAGVKTSVWSGVKPDVKTPKGQAFRQSLDEMKPEAAKGHGLDVVAADRARGPLGEELAGYQNQTLAKVGAQNAAMYAEGRMVSAEPLVKKNLELLRKATHADGGELPGHSVSSLGREMERMAVVRTVPASSDAAHAADPEYVLPAALAARMKIIPKSSGRMGDVVIIEPKNLSAEQLDDINQMYAARVNQGEWSPADAPIKALQAGGLATRGRLGSGVEKMKAEQAAALNEMNNALEAFGLPRKTAVDLSAQSTKNALERSVRGHKAGNTKANDDAIGAVADRNPAARTALDQAAAVGAYQRLRGQATPNVAMGPSGTVRPWGMMGAAKLHLDPLMGVFGSMGKNWPGLPYGLSSEAASRMEKKK